VPVPGPGVAGFTEPLVMLLSHLVELLPREHSVVVQVHHGKLSHLHTHTPLRSQPPLGDIAISKVCARTLQACKLDTNEIDKGATSTDKRGRDIAKRQCRLCDINGLPVCCPWIHSASRLGKSEQDPNTSKQVSWETKAF